MTFTRATTRAFRTAVLSATALALVPRLAIAEVGDVGTSIRAVADAAVRVGVDPLVLLAIAFHESAVEPWALNIDGVPIFPSSASEASEALRAYHSDAARGRIDVGMLQVNTQWLDRVSARGPFRIQSDDLLDPDVAATVGAGILKAEIEATSGDLWRAVARYHTGPERTDNAERGRAYAATVRRTYEYLQQHSSAPARASTVDPVATRVVQR